MASSEEGGVDETLPNRVRPAFAAQLRSLGLEPVPAGQPLRAGTVVFVDRHEAGNGAKKRANREGGEMEVKSDRYGRQCGSQTARPFGLARIHASSTRRPRPTAERIGAIVRGA